ncbi:MAG: sigma-70 family RNA polymerase sigma factor [Planctomycetota bacterium]
MTASDGDLDTGPTDPRLTDALLREAGWVRALAGRLARDQAAADDAAQGALVLALQKRPDPRRGLRPWLARVVARLARRDERAAARRAVRERSAAARRDPAAGTDDLLERLELQNDLADRVRALPEPYRGVLLRRFYDGRSPASIARETGASAATVRSQIARGLERLRHEFARDRSDTSLHGVGPLALLLLASGSRGRALEGAALEILAMKTSTKVLTAAALVTAAFVATRGFLASTSGGSVRTHATPARSVEGDRVPEGDGVLAAVEGDVAREGLRDVALAPPAASSEVAAPAAPEDGTAVSTVRARLVDEAGEPVAGAILRSILSSGEPRGEENFCVSDGGGAVEIPIEDRHMRAYRTEVFPMAFQASARFRATTFVVSTPRWHGTTDLGEVVLETGGAVEGRLVDAAGRAVADGRVFLGEAVVAGDVGAVRLNGPAEGRRPRALSGDDGRFLFSGAPLGASRLYAHAEGKLWTISERFDVARRSTADAGRLVLEPIPAAELVQGVVRRPDGRPAPGARIAFENRARHAEGTLTADRDGRFSYCPGGKTPVEMVARDPSGEHGMSAPVYVTRGEEVEIELTPRRVLRATVTDEDGAPLHEASLMPFLSDRDVFAEGGRPIPGVDWTRTDARGVAEIVTPPGEFLVTVSRHGFEARRFGPYTSGTAPASLEVELKREPHVAGRVMSAGAPVEGASIEIGQRIDGFIPVKASLPMRFFVNSYHGVRTDPDGRFECPVDPEWTAVSVLALREGLATGEVELTLEPGEGARGVALEMAAGGAIVGSVLAPVGYEPKRLYVVASRGDGHPSWTRASADGTYRLEGLTPGPWHVEGRLEEPAVEVFSVANTPEERDFDWNADVVDGAEVSVDLDMRSMGEVAVHGRLFVDGVPAEGWAVTLQRVEDEYSGDALPAVEIDASGGFVISARAGRATLTLTGTQEEGGRVEVVRVLDLKGTRIDWEESLTTGAFRERVEDGDGEIRLVTFSASGGELAATYLEPDPEGWVSGRAPAGAARLERRQAASWGFLWVRIREVVVR